jgi:hypothetical protein
MPVTINGSGTITGASTLATTPSVTQINSSAVSTPTLFGDSAGTQVGTLCRAWVNYKGTATVSIRASFNVSSVTVNGTGDYTINFTNALADANFSSVVSGGSKNAGYSVGTSESSAPTSSSFRVLNSYPGVGVADANYVFAAVFR